MSLRRLPDIQSFRKLQVTLRTTLSQPIVEANTSNMIYPQYTTCPVDVTEFKVFTDLEKVGTQKPREEETTTDWDLRRIIIRLEGEPKRTSIEWEKELTQLFLNFGDLEYAYVHEYPRTIQKTGFVKFKNTSEANDDLKPSYPHKMQRR